MAIQRIGIAEIRIGKRCRKSLGDIEALKKSIIETGLIQPIAVTSSGMLVAGRRRLQAFTELCKERKEDGADFSAIPAHVITIEDIRRGEMEENIQRLDFTAEEKAQIVEDLLEVERPKAQKRLEEGRKSGGRGKKKLSEKFSESKAGTEALAIAASFVGWSRPTAEKAIAVVKASEKAPKKHGKLLDAMNRTGKVNGVFRQLKISTQAEAIAKEPPPLPKGPFRVIVVDPPWQYDKRAEDPSHRAVCPYPTLPMDKIHEWKIRDMAHEDCVLWLWTTNSHIPQSFEIARKWGFEYKTMLTWVKDRMGTGDWLRGQTEHCLMCVRGKPTITLTNQTTALHGKMRKHSQKPEEFFSMVEAMCPGSKVEVFSREKRDGWVTFGDEV